MPGVLTRTDDDDLDADSFYGRYRERQRLERDVIEAAKVRHHAQTDYWDATRRGGGEQ